MKKERKQAIGYALIILGIVVIFIKQVTSITGFTITSESLEIIKDIWFIVAGLGMIVAGTILNTAGIEEKVKIDHRTHPEERAYLWKDLRNKIPDPSDIHRGFRPYGGTMDRAKEEAQKQTGWKKNPHTKGAIYMSTDGLVYSLDYMGHYAPLINAGLSNEEVTARLHFDITDPRTLEKIDEVDIEGRPLNSKREHLK
jgi:hypothetical protein